MLRDPFEGDVLALRRARANGDLVGVVGAGVSIGATRDGASDGWEDVASWKGLLENGIRRCARVDRRLDEEWVQRKLADVQTGRLEELLGVAQLVISYLEQRGDQEVEEWLYDSIGVLEARIRFEEDVRALHALGIPLITTNYDWVIEKITHRTPIAWTQRAAVERWFEGRGRDEVFHVHGHYRLPESIVLSPRSYDEIVKDERLRFLLQSLAAARTLLFVGCGAGLRDPNFYLLRRWMSRVLGSSRHCHYRLSTCGEQAALQTEHPLAEGIVVLPYGDDHASLTPFLRSLA